MLGQPDAPVLEHPPKSNKKYAEAPKVPTPPLAPIAPAEDASNPGNRLLKMMGWTAGTGLGVDGEGRVDPM